MADFPYHCALIIGAGPGISASLARRLTKIGLQVGLAARDVEKLKPLAEETAAAVFAVDASQPGPVAKLFLDMERQVAEPDIVIYNASSRVPGPLSSVDPAAVEKSIAITTFGAFLAAQQAAALQGLSALQLLMDDCDRMNHATLQWLTQCLTPAIVDRAVGDMKLDSAEGPQLATYVRYNVILEHDWLKDTLGVDLPPEKIAEIRRMDDPGNMNDVADLGRRAAAKQVLPGHLPAAFDLTPASP